MKKLLLSVFVMCAMYESAWSRIERICIAPAGCQIIMNTGECPDCIDKFIPDVVTETYEEAKVEKKEEKKVDPSYFASQKLLALAGITVRKYEPKVKVDLTYLRY